MNTQSQGNPSSSPLVVPEGTEALKSPGANWAPVGMSGEASVELPLPISAGRGFDPALTLSYRSGQGNSPFGLGWAVPVATISRDIRKGVPTYTDNDVFISPQGVDLIPERDADGAIHSVLRTAFNDLALNETHRVVRYFPAVEAQFDRIEHWSPPSDAAGFWLIQAADGNVHLFGKTDLARCTDPGNREHVACWFLQESLNPLGEQIYYHYKQEDALLPGSRDFRAQRYLERVCYGNLKHQSQLALWNSPDVGEKHWHFELLFDYGERNSELTHLPGYAAQQSWGARPDPFLRYAFGFELGTQRLCRQILMFHYFPDEPTMGPEPVLTKRLVLEYSRHAYAGSYLRAVHNQAYDGQGQTDAWPPLELAYQHFKPLLSNRHYRPFEAMAGLNDGHHYQLVDLFNDGLPGLLCRTDKSWHYREPTRALTPGDTDDVAYGPQQQLPRIPVNDSTHVTYQALMDVNGDGQLEWVTAQPGLSGFFSLGPQRQWSDFTPFAALPQEFFHPHGQLADLMGAGCLDLTLIGSRSVRLYAGRQAEGYGPGVQVTHAPDDDQLPTLSNGPGELVAFCDPLGSGQQHLVRIRHNEIKCWPNLGRGHFGRGFVFATLPFAYDEFDAARIRLADLDGSGAVDVLYLQADQALIFMNRFGTGLVEPAMRLPWPEGVRYDSTCQVSVADLQGVGCSSLILTVPHKSPRHWRYDFVRHKPYLLNGMLNNMGAATQLGYRSSAQEWLDEKRDVHAQATPVGRGMPFTVHVLKSRGHKDLVSGDSHSQHFTYRESCYDSEDRKFIGFGLLLETDGPPTLRDSGVLLTKRWFHTLYPPHTPYYTGDAAAPKPGATLLTGVTDDDPQDRVLAHPLPTTLREVERALSGVLLREEIYAADDPPQTAVPYSVQHQRYLVRLLKPSRHPSEPAALMPRLLESVTCRYERQKDDPLCRHQINLRWDRYGALEHSIAIDHARRTIATDAPPFSEANEQQWWRDAHDPAQQSWYLNETCTQWIHLDATERWRLQLPYRQRSNVLVLAKDALRADQIAYEYFTERHAAHPLGPSAQRQLAGLSVHHYCQADCSETLAPGTASFQALTAYLEVAELDEPALAAYQHLPTLSLTTLGYRPMRMFLPEDSVQPSAQTLWSLTREHVRYDQSHGFFRPRRQWASVSHVPNLTEYDAYCLHVIQVTTADGCTTSATYDYRLGLPVLMTDAQRTQQYVHYNALGQMLAVGMLGHEGETPIGADTRASFKREPGASPLQAIAAPEQALGDAQSAFFHEAFSWMGRIVPASVKTQWIERGYLLPGGHIRGSALLRLNALASPQPHHLELKALIQATPRQPVHTVAFQSDRLQGAGAPEDKHIQVALAFRDGFGRILQHQQKTQPGPAMRVNDRESLDSGNHQALLEVQTPTCWRISAPTEYNAKGLISRTWRPYFADRAGYINDDALRTQRHSERYFYDPLGRPLRTLNANNHTRRQTYWAWYTVSEDENDTLVPPATG